MNDDTKQLREEIDNCNKAIGDLEDTNDELVQRIRALESKLANLKSNLKKSDNINQNLHQEISDYKVVKLKGLE